MNGVVVVLAIKKMKQFLNSLKNCTESEFYILMIKGIIMIIKSFLRNHQKFQFYS